MGIRVAHQLVSPNLLDYIELSKDYTIAELAVPNCLNGKSLQDINTRARYGCSIVAINRPKGGVIIAPAANEVLAEKDVMVVIGTNKQIEQFEEAIVR